MKFFLSQVKLRLAYLLRTAKVSIAEIILNVNETIGLQPGIGS